MTEIDKMINNSEVILKTIVLQNYEEVNEKKCIMPDADTLICSFDSIVYHIFTYGRYFTVHNLNMVTGDDIEAGIEAVTPLLEQHLRRDEALKWYSQIIRFASGKYNLKQKISMNETVFKAIEMHLKNHLTADEILVNLIKDKINANLEHLSKHQYVVLPEFHKIIEIEKNIYYLFKGSMLFRYDAKKDEVSESEKPDLDNFAMGECIRAFHSEFDKEIWMRHLASAKSKKEIEKAKENFSNVIVKEGDIDKDELDNIGIEYKNNLERRSVKGIDYSIFTFNKK